MFARAYSCVYLNRLRTLVQWPQDQQFYTDLTEDVNDNVREETSTASRQQFPASSSSTDIQMPPQTSATSLDQRTNRFRERQQGVAGRRAEIVSL